MRSYRFSLKTLLFAAVFIALSVALWETNRNVDRLRQDLSATRQKNRELQAELGRFSEVDRNLIQAVRVYTPQDDLRRYRLFLPIDRKYRLYIAHGHVPADGLPPTATLTNLTRRWTTSSSPCEPGEFTLDVNMEQVDNDWTIRASRLTGKRAHTKSNLAEFNDWLNDRRAWWFDSTVGEKVITSPKDQPLILFCLRRAVVTELGDEYAVGAPQGPADGIIIWIE